MKAKKLFALCISAIILWTPVCSVGAESVDEAEQNVIVNGDNENESTSEHQEGQENTVENVQKVVEEQAKEEKSSNIQSNNEVSDEKEETQFEKARKPDDMNGKLTGGYIKSDLDQNTPVYNPAARSANRVPSSYPTDMNAYHNKFPDNRNQNPYGTCWAFASLGLAEYDLIMDGGADKNIDLSELQLAYFTYNFVTDPLGGTEGDTAKYYNENAPYTYLNYGGNYLMASRRLGQWVGAANESDVPYRLSSSTVTNGLDSKYAYNYDKAHLENTYLINIKKNAADVKRQIIEHGAAGVMYCHDDNSLYWNSSSQYYTYYDTAATGGGHAVMVVGWDDNFSKDNFGNDTKPSSDGAWLIRNSWGYYCSYFWMSYETTSLSDTAWVFDVSNDDGYDNNYQYDGGLSVYPTGYTTTSNVFSVPQKDGVTSETLKAVSLSCTSVVDVGYKIQVYTDLKDKKNPESGILQENATTEGATEYAGTYTIPLENTVELKPGSSYAVVVKLDTQALDYEQAVSIASGDTKIWDCAVSLGNEKSFYKTGGKYYPFYWGNYCIKAFTSNNAKRTYSISYELDGGTNDADNPTEYSTGNDKIGLKAPTKKGYTFEGWFLDNDYKTVITEIPAGATQNYVLYAKWKKENNCDELAYQNKDVISDGEYAIALAVKDKYVLDVKSASQKDKANVQIYVNYNNPNQRWIISHDAKGYVTIANVNSKKVLTVDKAEKKELVYQEENKEAENQKWIVTKTKKGYQIHSALNFNYVLDLKDGNANNSTLIQVYENYINEAQVWNFVGIVENELDKQAKANKDVISDGEYAIALAVKDKYVLDVKSASQKDKANVQIYVNYNNPNQRWIISHDAKGYVTIANVNSKKVLTVDKAEKKELVYQEENKEAENQKWIVTKTKKGYQIHSALNFNYVLDLKDGNANNSTLIQVYENYINEAQVWNFKTININEHYGLESFLSGWGK